MSLNDVKYLALGASGDINDSFLIWLQANGATSNELNTAQWEYLIAQGATSRELNSMWFEVTGNLGHTGALNDRLHSFWSAQVNPVIVDTAVANSYNYMSGQGWNCQWVVMGVEFDILVPNNKSWRITGPYVRGCDYSNLPSPMANDMMDSSQAQGLCLV